jgi:hypothetical protein
MDDRLTLIQLCSIMKWAAPDYCHCSLISQMPLTHANHTISQSQASTPTPTLPSEVGLSTTVTCIMLLYGRERLYTMSELRRFQVYPSPCGINSMGPVSSIWSIVARHCVVWDLEFNVKHTCVYCERTRGVALFLLQISRELLVWHCS